MATKTKSKKSSVRSRVQGKPEVLARFTDAQLEAMEKRANRPMSRKELRELEQLADEGYREAEATKQLLLALRDARIKQNLSQAQLDEKTGIGRANLSRLENLHLDNPTLDTVMRYAHAVGLKLKLVGA